MASRAVVRARRLLAEGCAPAALRRRGGKGPSPPPSRAAVRSMTSGAMSVGTPCCSCEKQLLDLRRDMLAENQRVWKMYEGLLKVNQGMLKKMCAIEAEAAARQIEAVEAMVNTSYKILGSGGAFMLGMFIVMSPLLKAAWQQETIEAMEMKLRLQKIDAAIKAGRNRPAGGAMNAEGAKASPSCSKVEEETGRLDNGPASAVVKGEETASASVSAQQFGGIAAKKGEKAGNETTSADGKEEETAPSASAPEIKVPKNPKKQ